MALPIESCQYVPSIAQYLPTGELEFHPCGRICGDVEALCIIANGKPIRVCFWAFCAERVVIDTRRSVGDSLPVTSSGTGMVEQTALQKKLRTILYVVSAIAMRVRRRKRRKQRWAGSVVNHCTLCALG